MGIIILVIILIVVLASDQGQKTSSSGGPSVSIGGVITYPEDMSCEHCGNSEFDYRRDIDSSTWDMKCPECKEIAYKHPKREERQQQIEDMLS